jgi:ketosteroid isomerase-like protein
MQCVAHRLRSTLIFALLSGSTATTLQGQQSRPAAPEQWEASLLEAREAVWRDYFRDPDALAAVLTDDFIAIDNGGGVWKNREQTVAGSRGFVASGGSLVSLTFPVTRIQRYGDVAIIYTEFRMVLRNDGEDGAPVSGRATEVFLWRDGRWLHPGWHLDSGR